MAKPPLIFTYYIAAPLEKVWDGFVSKEANEKIFLGADLRGGPAAGRIRWRGRARERMESRCGT
jgi:uncharacterized protein YndB with AHSA1/START domain